MYYDYSHLIGRIIEKYKTRTAFANAIGMTKQGLHLKLSGKNGLSQDDIVKWCMLLEIPFEEIGAYFFVLKVKSA